jgi:16S rRNA (cytidine1402-2'-O)-methyltransferase
LRDLAEAAAVEPPPKGEIVVLVGPPSENERAVSDEELDARLLQALEHLSVKDAAALVATEISVPRRRAYARAIELSARPSS